MRLLEDDEAVAPPSASTRLDDVPLPYTRKARDLAPSFPAGQKRILEIDNAFVFRFTHGRTRVLTWLDEKRQVMWLCAADLRRANDDYDVFVDLHRRGELLPGESDVRRLDDERLLELAYWIRQEVPTWVVHAQSNPEAEHPFQLPGGACIYVFARDVGELWVAMPTLLAEDLGIPDQLRSLIVALVTHTLGGADATEWEARGDWPTGRALRNYELALVWVK